jgi:nucleotide-binding universal stress UspA family protein
MERRTKSWRRAWSPRGSCGVARRIRCTLIMLATHGRTGLKHVLLGSVAEDVVRRAPCPVLIVRPRGYKSRG